MSPSAEDQFDPCGTFDERPVCDCIEKVGGTITAAILAVRDAIGTKVNKPCDDIDNCIDKIIAGIDKKLGGALKSCDECRQMVASGLGGTLQYAIQCASVVCDKCNTVCSKGDKSTEGKCCNTCGKPNCKCIDGTCKPVESTDSGKQWIAWCNKVLGLYAVTQNDGLAPGAGYVQVGGGETEQEARAIAQSMCAGIEMPPLPPKPIPSIPPPQSSGIICDISQYRSGQAISRMLGNGQAENLVGGLAQMLTGLRENVIGNLGGAAIGDFFAGFMRAYYDTDTTIITGMTGALTAAIGCDSNAWKQALTMLAAVGQAQKYFGVNLEPWTAKYKYAMNAGCRQNHLDPDKAVAAYLGNAIDYKGLDEHWAIAGICPESLGWYLQAAKAKPNPFQLAILRRRKLASQSEYISGMRQLGYLEPQLSENLFKLTEQVPTLSDIIRLMVRDADDTELAAKFNLDEGFTEKYQKQLREWSEFQGIPEQVARYSWRAHWSIPAPTQLFEFYHRLRNNPEFGGEEKILDDVKTALIQQDILPYWHKHFLAVSFKPLARVDVRRGFDIGALTENDVRESYVQLGYNDKSADALVRLAVRLRRNSIRGSLPIRNWIKFSSSRDQAVDRLSSDGIPQDQINQALSDAEPEFAKSTYAAAYVRGELDGIGLKHALSMHGVSDDGISRIIRNLSLRLSHHRAIDDLLVGRKDSGEVLQAMSDDGMDSIYADGLVKRAERKLSNAFLVACQRGIKRRYLTGEFDKQSAVNELIRQGTTANYANRLATNWDCEKSSSGKPVATSKLCGWLSQGVIGPQEFIARLKRIGHSEADASLILSDCLTATNITRLKQAEKETKDQVAAAEKIANAIAKQNAAVERNAAKMAELRSKAAKAKQGRDKQRLSAAVKMSKKCDCEVYESLQAVAAEMTRAQTEYGATIDEGIEIVLKAVEAWEGGEPDTLRPLVTQFAAAVSGKSVSPAGVTI